VLSPSIATDDVLPRAVRLACWFAAYAEGRASLDDALTAITGQDQAHAVVGLPGGDPVTPLVLALGRLRALAGPHTALALPAPGDPVGLAGPPEFTIEAVDAGAAVTLPGAGLGLVPRAVAEAVRWRVFSANPPVPVDVADADRGLRGALRDTAARLAALDVARWRPEVADALMDLRRPRDLGLPPGTSAPATALVGVATRCLHVVALALTDEGGAVSASEAAQRRDVMRPLDSAARRGLSAACSSSPAR